jgi:hypothetical protein
MAAEDHELGAGTVAKDRHHLHYRLVIMKDSERGGRFKRINRLGHWDVTAVIIFAKVQNWIGKVAAYFLGRGRLEKEKGGDLGDPQ